MNRFLREVEERYREFLDAEVECSEESRRCLARIGKAMLHHSDAILKERKKKRKGGKK